MSVGGSIESISISGRIFPVASDAAVTTDVGGFSSELVLFGNGTANDTKTRKAWMLEGIEVGYDDSNGGLEFLQSVADGVNSGADGFFAIDITYASGVTRMGRGKLTGDLKGDSSKNTASITLSGTGKLEQQ